MSMTAPNASSVDGDACELISSRLHVFVASDWGEEIDLPAAARLLPAVSHALPRSARTPPTFQYSPAPLRFSIPPISLRLPEVGDVTASADVTLFDFGAISAALHVPLKLPLARWPQLAGGLEPADPIVAAVQQALRPVFERLGPTIREPRWSTLSEEYFVFEFVPGAGLPEPERLLGAQADWLAALVRLESEPLSPSEVTEALRSHMSYAPDDLVVADWAAAVVVDDDCDEVLDTIALANAQLLEFRHLHALLDQQLDASYPLIHHLARTGLPLWRTHARKLRALGKLKVDASEMLERTSNVLMLIGDQYLARMHQMLASRFHLEGWGASIRRSLNVLESIYQAFSDQSATYRAELLELLIVLMILFEIVSPLWK